MAFTKSGIYLTTILDALEAIATTPTTELDLRKATAKIALASNSLTDGSAPVNFSATTVTWANTNEIAGTGWAAGGVLLSGAAAGATSTVPTFAEGTTGSLRYDMGDISVASTTLTAAHGCIIYLDAITAPTALVDAMICAISFGADYSTVAGTFGVTWSGTGLFEIDLTP